MPVRRVEDVHLLLEFLEAPEEWRRETAARLRRRLESVDEITRHSVPCVRPWGSFVMLPGRMAAWLMTVLEKSESEVAELRRRLENGLEGDSFVGWVESSRPTSFSSGRG